jgi:hypothetical protein
MIGPAVRNVTIKAEVGDHDEWRLIPALRWATNQHRKGVDVKKAYLNWLGKGDLGRQEWVFRMPGPDNTDNRANRTSFSIFTPRPGVGTGSY